MNEEVLKACYSVLSFETSIGGYNVKSDGKMVSITDPEDYRFYKSLSVVVGYDKNEQLGVQISCNKKSKLKMVPTPGYIIDNAATVRIFIAQFIESVLKEL